MTFAEILLMIAVAVGFYYLLRPMQKRIERAFLKWLRRNTTRNGSGRPIIDISDYQPKKPNSPPNSSYNSSNNSKDPK